MNRAAIFASLLLWSGLSTRIALATVETTFEAVDIGATKYSSEIKVSNLPRIRSQDSFGLCAGFSSAFVGQHYLCKTQNIPDCSKILPEKEVSPLYMMTLAKKNDEKVDDLENSNHANLHLFGGDALRALRNFSYWADVAPESCAPFDQIAARYGGNNPGAEAAYKDLKARYRCTKLDDDQIKKDDECKTFLKDRTEAVGACLQCDTAAGLGDALAKGFNIQIPLDKIKKYSKRSTDFNNFLYDAFFSQECESLIDLDRPRFHVFPPAGKTASQEQSIAKIKEVLSKGDLLQISGLCPYYDNGKCVQNHSAAIGGYRKVCTNGCEGGDNRCCRHAVRLLNSWGKEWQEANSDGWIYFDKLFKSEKNPAQVPEASLHWITPST